MYTCKYSEYENVQLVDTPGFDDTNRTDTEVLEEIAKWLTATYRSNIKLRGIIYLHRISDPRMPGAARRNLLMFTKLCGVNACPQILLATTWWEKADFKHGVNREKELSDTPDFWGYMLSKGSRVERHVDNRESAMRLIASVVERGKASEVALDLQKQMVDEKKTLIQTTAGIELEGELLKTTQKFQKQIDKLQKEHKEAQKMQEKEMAKELEAQKKELTEKLCKTEREQADLHRNSQREHDRKFSELQAQLQAARDDADAREARQRRILENQRETQRKQESQQKQEIENMRRQLEASQLSLVTPTKTPSTKVTPPFPEVTPTAGEGNLPPGTGRKRIASLSIVGPNYYFIGAGFRAWIVGSGFEREENRRGDSTQHLAWYCDRNDVALGTNGSWYRTLPKAFFFDSVKLRKSNTVRFAALKSIWLTETEWSENFASEYPSLEIRLKRLNGFKKPVCLSLGPDGVYFARTNLACYHVLPPGVKANIGDMSKVRRMWFGMNQAWLAVADDGQCWFDFKGGYKELERKVRAENAPQVVAMNLTDPDEFVAVWANGACNWKTSGKGIDSGDVREFLSRNGYK
ncbi:MAG: hypothetical protein Q9180_004988 [Flavoplaca navasiana]